MTRKADLIDRDALLDDIAASVVFSGRTARNAEIRGANKIIDRIKAAPTIDAEPVKHGRWELVEYQCTPLDTDQTLVCTECGFAHQKR